MIRKLLQYLGADPIEDAMSVRDIPSRYERIVLY